MNRRKTIIALLASAVVIAGTCGAALAANRFSVRDSAGTTDKLVVTDSGAIG